MTEASGPLHACIAVDDRVLGQIPTGRSEAAVAQSGGGRLVICEELRTPVRLAIQFFWSYFLVGVDSCASRVRSIDHYLQVLEEEGFTGAHVVTGSFDLICATRE